MARAANFNPRHPCGWRRLVRHQCFDAWTISIHATHAGGEFQSTPPMRVATYEPIDEKQTKVISIHATHAGGDVVGVLVTFSSTNFNPRHPCGWRPNSSLAALPHPIFQSTPPMRVATGCVGAYRRRRKFQSTPPMRVATIDFCGDNQEVIISIHATHAGGDLGADSYISSACSNFNPRHPCGWRLNGIDVDKQQLIFQSTPPMRVATYAL